MFQGSDPPGLDAREEQEWMELGPAQELGIPLTWLNRHPYLAARCNINPLLPPAYLNLTVLIKQIVGLFHILSSALKTMQNKA